MLCNNLIISLTFFSFLFSFSLGAMEIDFKFPPTNSLNSNNKDARIDYDEDAGIIFGRGYDTLSDSVRGDCIERSDPETPDGSEAQKISFSIHHISNSIELMDKLNLNAAASIKTGWGHGSAKTEFASQYSLSSYSVYVMAKVLVRNIMRTVRYPKLTKEAKELYEASPQHFRKRCGDDYLGSITSGGEFYAVLEIQTKTVAQKTDVLSRLEGGFGTMDALAGFSQSLSKITNDYSTKVAVYKVGGKFDEKVGVPTTPEQIIAYAKIFPSTVVGRDAMPISATTYSYTSVGNFPSEVEPWGTEVQEDIVKRMIKYQNAFLTDIANIDYILFHQDQFINPNVPQLNEYKQKLAEQVNLVMSVAKRCFANLTQCQFPENMQYPAFVFPDRVKGFFMKDLCEFKEDESCGVLLYKEMASPHCGVMDYNRSRGAQCGVELYKLDRAASCGVISYNERKDPSCGIKRDYLIQEYEPGYRNCLPGRDNVGRGSSYEFGFFDKYFPENEWNCDRREPLDGRGRRYNPPQSICSNKRTGAQWILCMGEVNLTCRKPEFGIELAEKCRTPENGVESYLPCRDKAFGVESYLSCRDSHHDVEKYDKCYAPKKDLKDVGEFQCSKNPKDYQ